jgi:ribose-phosphate pyrophosphokinase
MTGNSNKPLAESVAKALGVELLAEGCWSFADGEVYARFKAKDVIGKDCYIIQSTCRPVNDSFMELIAMVSACKRAGCRSVTAIVPYYGYARCDRRFTGDAQPISAADTTQILEFMGVNRVVAVDLHVS